MPRVSLVLWIVACLAAGTAGYLRVQSESEKRILERQLDTEKSHAATLASDLAAAREQTAALKSKIADLADQFSTAKARLETTEARAQQLERDLGKAQGALSVHELNAKALASEIAAQRATVADLERQLANQQRETERSAPPPIVFKSRAGTSTVLSVGPQNAFVVLNFGAERGAQIGQKLAISQGTEALATVLISDVRSNFSIAQVLPETVRGVLQKGDSALLLR